MAKTLSRNGDRPRVSSIDEFPAPLEEVITVELDTGRVVDMVIAELYMLYEAGDIPDELTPVAVRALFPAGKENEAERERDYRERVRLARWVAGKVLRCDVPVERLYLDEIWQIYELANKPAMAVRNFRRQQARHVATVSEVQDVEPVAEREIGDNE